jgi:hypothetical protein
MVPTANTDYSSNSITQFIFVMLKCGVLFEVWTEFLNTLWTSFGFEELNLEQE